MRFSAEQLRALRAEARRRADQSRIERAVALVTRYRDFTPFPTGPDSDLTPDVLKKAHALFLRRRRHALRTGSTWPPEQ